MTTTVRAAQLFLIILCVSCCYIVTTRKIKMAWALELALMLLTFAIVGALDAVLSDRPFLDREAVAARWLLVGSAVACIVGLVLVRLLSRGGPRTRTTDFVELTAPSPLDAAKDRRRRAADRPMWRWRGGKKKE